MFRWGQESSFTKATVESEVPVGRGLGPQGPEEDAHGHPDAGAPSGAAGSGHWGWGGPENKGGASTSLPICDQHLRFQRALGP